jgi:hypothetical protein
VEPNPGTVAKLAPKRASFEGSYSFLAAAAALLVLLAAYFLRLFGEPHQANPDHPDPSVHVPVPPPPSAMVVPQAPAPVAPKVVEERTEEPGKGPGKGPPVH